MIHSTASLKGYISFARIPTKEEFIQRHDEKDSVTFIYMPPDETGWKRKKWWDYVQTIQACENEEWEINKFHYVKLEQKA